MTPEKIFTIFSILCLKSQRGAEQGAKFNSSKHTHFTASQGTLDWNTT